MSWEILTFGKRWNFATPGWIEGSAWRPSERLAWKESLAPRRSRPRNCTNLSALQQPDWYSGRQSLWLHHCFRPTPSEAALMTFELWRTVAGGDKSPLPLLCLFRRKGEFLFPISFAGNSFSFQVNATDRCLLRCLKSFLPNCMTIEWYEIRYQKTIRSLFYSWVAHNK